MTLLVGDIHGDWGTLFEKLDRLGIVGCDLICVGDAGIGFQKDRDRRHSYEAEFKQLKALNQKFHNRGIKFSTIRGNHDDPDYWKDMVSFPFFELIPDNTLREIEGQKWFFVGGALSVDKYLRLHKGWDWWSGEGMIYPDAVPECDVLVTHNVPSYLGPNNKLGVKEWLNWCDEPEKFWAELNEERKQIDQLVLETKAKTHYCGHMHVQAQVEHNGCLSKILDILEIVEHRA